MAFVQLVQKQALAGAQVGILPCPLAFDQPHGEQRRLLDQCKGRWIALAFRFAVKRSEGPTGEGDLNFLMTTLRSARIFLLLLGFHVPN